MNTQHQNKTCVCIQKLVICSQTGHKHMPIKLNVNKHAYIEHECFPYEFEVMHMFSLEPQNKGHSNTKCYSSSSKLEYLHCLSFQGIDTG